MALFKKKRYSSLTVVNHMKPVFLVLIILSWKENNYYVFLFKPEDSSWLLYSQYITCCSHWPSIIVLVNLLCRILFNHRGRVFSFCFLCSGDILYQLIFSFIYHCVTYTRVYKFSVLPDQGIELKTAKYILINALIH